jgi:ergothioneine biosynthesis protein EgtB
VGRVEERSHPHQGAADAPALERRYLEVRRATEALTLGLSAEDCAVQSMALTSPIKWHLAHTSWFFETFILEPADPDFRPFDRAFRVLFNSYYNSVGEQYSRPERGLLTRPGLERVLEYRRHIDARMRECLADAASTGARVHDFQAVLEVGIHHEQQHQELILTDLKHLLSRNPLHPAYRERRGTERTSSSAAPLAWCAYPGGPRAIGHAGPGFAFDNERPRHTQHLRAFELASRAVTNREYLEFIDAGGYRKPELWLADGWDAARRAGWEAPEYWIRTERGFSTFTLGGLGEMVLDEPVCHVSYYEADAFARAAGARLPTEAEWEVAAAGAVMDGTFVESGQYHPRPAPALDGDVPVQMLGDVWEWTSSAYGAYPGYRPPRGALGEYNGKFMCNQLVLRGGSCATPRSHIRPTYRNFFYPDARWQFSGIRLARDID